MFVAIIILEYFETILVCNWLGVPTRQSGCCLNYVCKSCKGSTFLDGGRSPNTPHEHGVGVAGIHRSVNMLLYIR